MNKIITIITIVNNEDMYSDFLKNIEKQTFDKFDMIKISNNNNEFNSATKAFNSVIDKIKTEYVCFLHPDIRFIDNNGLKMLMDYVLKIKDFGVVGIAGAAKGVKKERIIYSTIVHGNEKRKVGVAIESAVEVQTVDECLFVIKLDKLKKMNFIERNLWHFYSVEYCLQSLLNNEKNYVVPCNLWHISDGKSLDKSYVKGLKLLAKEYRDRIPIFYTTVRKWDVSSIFGRIYIEYYYIKQIIKRILKKRR